ncbi:MAG: adenosylcobinamide-phosphate synthase CbiB [Burkholderiales bacterium]|nr:cobalamin biosynthesis protein [Ferrovum sp.]
MTASIVLLAAVLLDKLFGELRRWHPLVGFGQMAAWVERVLLSSGFVGELAWKTRLRGMAGLAMLLVPAGLVIVGLSAIPKWGHLFDVLFLYLALGAKSLDQHAAAVVEALERKNLPLARTRVGLIVSRDTSQLDETNVARATVESVLENGGDAIFSAIFWFLLLGAPGAFLYRLANTLDAMWGYRNERYLYFGWAAARFDDMLNFIPARLTALTYTLLGNAKVAWQCWRLQAHTWYSPNAGPVMAAGAGALGVLLGGAACYHGKVKSRPLLGVGRAPESADIQRALQLVNRGLWLWVTIALAVGWHNA